MWLLFGAWRASSHALDQLMDKEWPQERRLRLVEVAARHPEGRGIHDLRTRTSGANDFAQFHLWLDPEMSVARAHDVVEEIEIALAAEFPGVEVLIHLDPEGKVDQPGQPARRSGRNEEFADMTELPFIQVDAFADRPFTGNPAAVMPLDAWLPDDVLQAIALENNLSETAFTIPCADGEADYELRWFTPTVEIALCGHATLASGHVLLGGRGRIRFRTRKAGILEVARDGDGYALSLPRARARPAAAPAGIVEDAGLRGG